MTPQEFVEKWRRANLSERSACQQHFLDLCELLGQPKPAAADPDGAWYTFERGVTKTEGGNGWADVWMKGHFGWEYKGKHKDLVAAYRQLLLYREDLDNPPLLVVCDLNRFEIHTNFTGTAKRIYAFDLDGLTRPENLDTLRKLFTEPESLRPGQTAVRITEEMANLFGRIADGMRVRGIEAHAAAHFLMKLMFCMFGEDIGLLPEKVFSTILNSTKINPTRLSDRLRALFAAMAGGGDFGPVAIPYFNGGLFSDDEVFDLSLKEIEELIAVNSYDWASVEPSIFGTLFERTLDPDKRAQIGAHYTSRADILTLLEPVVMTPLRREWDAVRSKCDKLWDTLKADVGSERPARGKTGKPRKDHDKLLRDFVEHLAHVTILDPACGSGNFLYVAINLLLELEKEVIAYAASHGAALLPQARPTQLHGIEVNPYAQQLAQVVIWIGYLQWMHHNGFNAPRDPILEPIDSIRLMDAIVDLSDPENPKEPKWPKADYIVGNPPFLGGKLIRQGLGDAYVDALFHVWNDRVPREADLCCYWFEKGRAGIKSGRHQRVGLLATQGIRGGSNRKVLERIKESGDIFFAESDRDWVLNGASVHVSFVGFDNGEETARQLDGNRVTNINANLTAIVDITAARRLSENKAIGFMGDTKVGPFEVSDGTALEWLVSPNPSGMPNTSVVRPWMNTLDLTRRNRCLWIVDFPPGTLLDRAAQFEKPFEHIKKHVQAFRAKARSGDRTGVKWWVHQRPRPEMRHTIESLHRYLATPTVSKHRVFYWLDPAVLPDHQLIVFGRSEDWFFGVLQSHVHDLWALCQGTRLETRPRYTPTTSFETFPFPVLSEGQRTAIAEAAKELDTLRNNWLNPPEWTREEVLEFPGSIDGPWARYVVEPNARGIGTVRYPRLVPKDEDAAKALAKRTLTNLYNERPTWLDLAHKKLDAAVFDAYGWPTDLSDDDLLARLLALNLERSRQS